MSERIRQNTHVAVIAVVAHVFAFVMPLVLPYMVMFAAFSKHAPFDRLTKGHDYSYGLYLYAWPLQLVLLDLFHNTLNPIALFGMAFVSSLMAAMLSWHFVEGPSMRLKGKKTEVVSQVSDSGSVVVIAKDPAKQEV
jgi:peptidoglycan/LPS O-acetylase OafA/YrhL